MTENALTQGRELPIDQAEPRKPARRMLGNVFGGFFFVAVINIAMLYAAIPKNQPST